MEAEVPTWVYRCTAGDALGGGAKVMSAVTKRVGHIEAWEANPTEEKISALPSIVKARLANGAFILPQADHAFGRYPKEWSACGVDALETFDELSTEAWLHRC